MRYSKKKKGWHYEIHYAETKTGRCPVKKYFSSLEKRKRAKLNALVVRYAEKGEIRNPEQFRKLKGANGIYEFKDFQARLLCYFDGDRLILTHGFNKKGINTPPEQIERAQRIREEFKKREEQKQ